MRVQGRSGSFGGRQRFFGYSHHESDEDEGGRICLRRTLESSSSLQEVVPRSKVPTSTLDGDADVGDTDFKELDCVCTPHSRADAILR